MGIELINITMKNLTDVATSTSGDPIEFFINVSQIVYNGWYWFIMLAVLWIILFFAAQEFKDLGLINFMYAGALISIISFIFRAITVLHDGVIWGMLSDFQMWVFPLITIICAVIVYNTKPAYN